MRHDRAVEAGICLIPAAGFDVVPSDCLAAMLAKRLPSATLLQLAFAFRGAMSPGTAKTTLEAIPYGARVRQGGRIVAVPLAWKSTCVPFADGVRWAATVPWGDVASAWHSTGIPDIEVYMAMVRPQIQLLRLIRPLLPALGGAALGRIARWSVSRFVSGPSTEQQRTSSGSFWGRVSNAQGDVTSATLTTPGGYPMTVLCALACLDRVLAGSIPPGFSTPSKAFGADFALSLPEVAVKWNDER